MEFNIGFTPEGVLLWIWSIVKKFLLWLLSFRPWYVGVIVSLLIIYLLYRLLDNYLYKKYRGEYEKSI